VCLGKNRFMKAQEKFTTHGGGERREVHANVGLIPHPSIHCIFLDFIDSARGQSLNVGMTREEAEALGNEIARAVRAEMRK
jgi:hypothetical protein